VLTIYRVINIIYGIYFFLWNDGSAQQQSKVFM